MAEKVPGRVERILVPSLETRVRGIVREEVDHLARVQDAKFASIGTRFDDIGTRFEGIDARLEAVLSRIDSLEKRMDDRFEAVNARFDVTDAKIGSFEKRTALVQDAADLKARLAAAERRTAQGGALPQRIYPLAPLRITGSLVRRNAKAGRDHVY